MLWNFENGRVDLSSLLTTAKAPPKVGSSAYGCVSQRGFQKMALLNHKKDRWVPNITSKWSLEANAQNQQHQTNQNILRKRCDDLKSSS